jgi:hypothetical protein
MASQRPGTAAYLGDAAEQVEGEQGKDDDDEDGDDGHVNSDRFEEWVRPPPNR